MTPSKLLFWWCLLLLLHAYVLYPVILFVVYAAAQIRRDWHYLRGALDRRRSPLTPAELPAISLIIPAYNEQSCLPEKIANLRQLNYPTEQLDIIFVSDGSTDRTNEILRSLCQPNLRTVFLPIRKGKPNANNHGVALAQHPIVVFSDAATLFHPDALRFLVRHFADPKVGAVCGAVRLQGTTESKQTEGVYWNFESTLRLMEGRLGATLSASGAIYALRRECYRSLTASDLIDDFIVPMNARKLGYRVLYDPEAIANEVAAASVRDEFTRRVRLAIGSFGALKEFARVPLSLFTCFAFFSHKLLRWILPFLMLGLLVSSLPLWNSPFYREVLIGQLIFYLWAGVGFAFRHQMKRVPYGLAAYYLLAIQLAFFVGFIRFLFGRTEATWQRVH